MKEKVQAPQLRFPGFTDDWEERKLGDEVTFFSGLTYSPDNIVESGSTLVLRSSNVKNGEIVDADNVYVENEAVNSDNVQVGDVIVVVRNGSRNLIGKHAQIKKEMDDTVIGAFMTGVRSDTPYFINALLDTEQFTREIYKNLGATINQITTGAFKKMQFVVPKNKTEKEQIGNFFKQIDDTIALHQRKLDLLKEQKKGYLQKMFPKNGAKVPELRFAGFADDWEERKLKELGDIQTGNTPPTSDSDNYSLDGVLWVTPTDIKSLVISNTAKKLSQVGVTKARIAKAGSILVTSIASIGKNTLLRMDAGFNQQINSLTPTSENDSYFLLTQSEKWSEKMKQTAASATMQIVNKTDFSNISTYVPVHKEEQEKIGSFFKQLDDTIALHQRKLDLLKEQKKGFLQKMFV